MPGARDGSARPQRPWLSEPGSDPVAAALAEFGWDVGQKLGRGGEPEDQLRGPVERLLGQLSRHIGLKDTVAYGEVRLKDLRARPDYAVDVGNARVGYVELKKPGHGVPLTPEWRPTRRERDQWSKLQALPNLLYTDGLVWRRYSYGEPETDPVALAGGFAVSDGPLGTADHRFLGVIKDFLLWDPEPPGSLARLIKIVAGLCDLLFDEVCAVLKGSPGHAAHEHLSLLAADWRDLLFPGLDAVNFADAFAQTITFAMLLARVDGISFEGLPLHEIGRLLGKKHSLIGRAFSVLTDGAAIEELRTISTLRRVIGPVTLGGLDDVSSDVYAELYERFLATYDPDLRTLSGSFYTPRPLATFIVRLVDAILRNHLGQSWGFADDVIVVDPAMGTGTFLVEVVSSVADTIDDKLGSGARNNHLEDLISKRLVGFEIQVAAYAVAELRLHQALKGHFGVEVPPGELRFLTDALANPREQQERLGTPYRVIEESREAANRIKREVPVMVVLGNPPHVKDSKGRAPWVEEPRRHPANPASSASFPSMDEFRAGQAGRYESDLHGMEWYFWRWACWKVFEAHPQESAGVVAFITPCSFLTGRAFAGMREYLRHQCDMGWIINLSPEGNRPPGATRIFKRDVGRQVCIAIFVRGAAAEPSKPADVQYLEVRGTRAEKLSRLESTNLASPGWARCRSGWQDVFLPAPAQDWDAYPSLAQLMPARSRGVTAGRSWVYAPEPSVLERRWAEFVAADVPRRRAMFHEKSRRTIDQVLPPLPGFTAASEPLARETGPCPVPVQVAYRCFDRQWLIPDKRLLAEARTGLWNVRAAHQIYLNEQDVQKIESGPALVLSALIPDIDHFCGWGGGGVHPLWDDRDGSNPNIARGLLEYLQSRLGIALSPADFIGYVAAVTSHPAYTARFRTELQQPGIRVPLSTDPSLWASAATLGRELIWLHTYGTRCADPTADRPAGERAIIERYGIKCTQPVVALPERLPDQLAYDERSRTLTIGGGVFGPLPRRAVDYDVNGRRVVWRWLNDRTAQPRHKRRTYPALDNLTVSGWSRRLTDELLALLAILTGCVALETSQQQLLGQICEGDLISTTDLRSAGIQLDQAGQRVSNRSDSPAAPTLFAD